MGGFLLAILLWSIQPCHGNAESDMLIPCAGRKAALIQRSCGYSLRPTLTIEDIALAVKAIKAADPQCTVLVDNCYGEFTEVQEPGQVSS